MLSNRELEKLGGIRHIFQGRFLKIRPGGREWFTRRETSSPRLKRLVLREKYFQFNVTERRESSRRVISYYYPRYSLKRGITDELVI